MYGGGFADELFRIPVATITVVCRPVLIYRGVLETSIGAFMRGDTGIVAVYVHFCRSIDYFYLLADILAGNAIIMGILAQPYMPVLHDGQHNRLPEFITYRIEFPQHRAFNLLELLPAAVILRPTKGVLLCISRATRMAAFKVGRSWNTRPSR